MKIQGVLKIFQEMFQTLRDYVNDVQKIKKETREIISQGIKEKEEEQAEKIREKINSIKI